MSLYLIPPTLVCWPEDRQDSSAGVGCTILSSYWTYIIFTPIKHSSRWHHCFKACLNRQFFNLSNPRISIFFHPIVAWVRASPADLAPSFPEFHTQAPGNFSSYPWPLCSLLYRRALGPHRVKARKPGPFSILTSLHRPGCYPCDCRSGFPLSSLPSSFWKCSSK